MKKIISSIVLLGIGFVAGYGVAKLGGSNPLAVIPNPVAAIKGEDSYEIKFEGNTGDKLVGSYVITTNPMRIEKIEDRLPYKVAFSAPRNVSVSASAFSFGGKSQVKVTILRNGIECNSIIAVGSGVPEGSKTCY
jgi:hypothetical protein